MKIIYPEFIYLMLIPSFILLYLVITNASPLERVFDSDILKKIKLDIGIDKKAKIVFLFIALFLMIFALSRPVIEKGEIEVFRKIPVVIALDVSKSNNLALERQKVKSFINNSNNLLISIILFSKKPYLISPLTSDKETLLFLLNHLDVQPISAKEANFLSALKGANELLKGSREKNIAIFTDRMDKDLSKETKFAKENHLRIFVIQPNSNIENILKYLKVSRDKKIVLKTELYPYILATAFLFLFITFFSFLSKRSFVIVFSLISLSSINLKAGILDFQDIKEAKRAYKSQDFKTAIKYFKKVADSKKSAQSFYDLANAYYKAKMYHKAIKYYNLVETPNKKLKFYTLCNLGNSYFMLKNYKKAVEFYKKALKLEDDEDCRYNLNLALKLLKKERKSLIKITNKEVYKSKIIKKLRVKNRSQKNKKTKKCHYKTLMFPLKG